MRNARAAARASDVTGRSGDRASCPARQASEPRELAAIVRPHRLRLDQSLPPPPLDCEAALLLDGLGEHQDGDGMHRPPPFMCWVVLPARVPVGPRCEDARSRPPARLTWVVCHTPILCRDAGTSFVRGDPTGSAY